MFNVDIAFIHLLSFMPSPLIPDQRHTLRDRRPSTAASPACWAMGIVERKKIFCAGPTRAATAKQKSLVPARLAQRNIQGKNPFHLYSMSPHSPQFQQSAGATLLFYLWKLPSAACTLYKNMYSHTQAPSSFSQLIDKLSQILKIGGSFLENDSLPCSLAL